MSNFIWRDVNSEEFDMRISHIGGQGFVNVPTYANSEIIKDRSMKRMESYIYYNRVSDTLEFPVQFYNKHGNHYRQNEVRAIQEWLNTNRNPEFLTILDPDKGGTSYLCYLLNHTKQILSNWVMGWSATVHCVTPYSFSNIVEKKYNISTGASNIVFYNMGDVEEYLYPTLQVRMTGTQTFLQIQNLDDNNRIFEISNIPRSATFTVNNDLGFIKSTNPSQNIFQGFNLNWFRLAPGINRLEVLGQCELTITTRFRRAIGGINS